MGIIVTNKKICSEVLNVTCSHIKAGHGNKNSEN